MDFFINYFSFDVTKSICLVFRELFFFFAFRAAPTAYGVSQARGRIRATAAGLRHSHSHARSKPRLRPTP